MRYPGEIIELASTIVDLYATFARYRRNQHVLGCPCCVTGEEQDRLVEHRLADVPAEALEPFAFAALYTWGTLNDFKHFLPRILELEAEGTLGTDLQVVYGKLVHEEEGPWPDAERRALERFTRSFFVEVVSSRARGSLA